MICFGCQGRWPKRYRSFRVGACPTDAAKGGSWCQLCQSPGRRRWSREQRWPRLLLQQCVSIDSGSPERGLTGPGGKIDPHRIAGRSGRSDGDQRKSPSPFGPGLCGVGGRGEGMPITAGGGVRAERRPRPRVPQKIQRCRILVQINEAPRNACRGASPTAAVAGDYLPSPTPP